jgi:hypothetical protein
MANVCWWCRWMWLRLAGRSERPRVRDVGHAHIRGLGTPRPWFVARPPSKVERAAGGRCSGDISRSCCARGRDARAASPAATGWLVQRRYLSDHSIQLVLSTPGGSEQARSNNNDKEVIELNAA